jgi:hypothetical protein
MVGPLVTCPNVVDDVQLVQNFLTILNRSHGAADSLIALPAASGTFNCATAFWIYHTQMRWLDQRRTRSFSGPPSMWDGVVYTLHADPTQIIVAETFIIALNVWANQEDPAAWRSLEASITAIQMVGSGPSHPAPHHVHHGGRP